MKIVPAERADTRTKALSGIVLYALINKRHMRITQIVENNIPRIVINVLDSAHGLIYRLHIIKINIELYFVNTNSYLWNNKHSEGFKLFSC